MSRYVIIGAGAVGLTLAAEWQRSGHEVVVVARGRQLELLRSQVVSYLRPDDAWTIDVPVIAGPDELELDISDVIVLATKTQDADDALAVWARQPVAGGRWRAGEALPVLTVQNGLDVERSALRRFANVVGAVVVVPSTYVTDGEILSPGTPSVGIAYVGAHPDTTPTATVRSIAADLRAARFEVQVVEDLSRWKAWKLLASITFALDALYPPGPERDRAARLVQAEARSVFATAGIDPADQQAESTGSRGQFGIAPIAGRERPGSSTYQSLARGRDAETDYLNGEIVLLAREHATTAPLSAALQSRVQRASIEGTAPGSLPTVDLAQLLASATVFTDEATLRIGVAGNTPPALLDVRWTLGDLDGEKRYLAGHLPGAVYVDLDTELAAPASAEAGRHPLPEIDDLQEAARRWGLRTGQPVVVYDDNGGQSAARAWWLLTWAGIRDVRILDGGLAAWSAELTVGAEQPDSGDVVLTPGNLPVLDIDEASDLPGHGVLIDARAGERYRGEVEPIDSRAGHVPGAVSLPTAANLGTDGRFLPVEALRDRFAAAGVAGDVGVYCGSGVTAAHEIAALRAAGIDAALYPGSWSAYSADPARPVATGPAPSDVT